MSHLDTKFKRLRILRIVIAIGFSTMFCFMMYFSIQRQSEKEAILKTNLGRKIWFDKDSVMITAYDTEQHVYLLSNGQKIDFSLVK